MAKAKAKDKKTSSKAKAPAVKKTPAKKVTTKPIAIDSRMFEAPPEPLPAAHDAPAPAPVEPPAPPKELLSLIASLDDLAAIARRDGMQSIDPYSIQLVADMARRML